MNEEEFAPFEDTAGDLHIPGGESVGWANVLNAEGEPYQPSLLDQLWTLPPEQQAALMWKNPAYAWTVIAVLNQSITKRLFVTGGLGLPEGILINLPGDQLRAARLVKLMEGITNHPPRTWNGLDMIQCERSALKVAAALWTFRDLLTQPLLDFILAKDQDAVPGIMIPASKEPDWAEYTTMIPEEAELAGAFRRQMVEEAAPFAHRPALGAYVMEREPFPRLDSEIDFRTLRLVITQRGIIGSLVMPESLPLYSWMELLPGRADRRDPTCLATPFAWTPGGVNTSQVFLSAKGVFAVDVLLACIWRDACIVREAWAERQNGLRPVELRGKPQHKPGVVVLPRKLYKSRWGASAAERQQAEAQARRAHSRGGCYPKLPPGFVAHDAETRAQAYNYAAPPPGHTFRKPYDTTGEAGGSAGDHVKVICKGLQVAHQILG